MRNRPKAWLVQVTNSKKRSKISLSKIQKLTERLVQNLKIRAELHITLVSDSQMKRINKLYHGTNTATDVLAFPGPQNWPIRNHPPSFLGEIVISVDRACAYAKQFFVGRDEELMRYVAHGILHLLGERDDKPEVHKKMHARQERLINLLKPIPKIIF